MYLVHYIHGPFGVVVVAPAVPRVLQLFFSHRQKRTANFGKPHMGVFQMGGPVGTQEYWDDEQMWAGSW